MNNNLLDILYEIFNGHINNKFPRYINVTHGGDDYMSERIVKVLDTHKFYKKQKLPKRYNKQHTVDTNYNGLIKEFNIEE